MTNTKPGSEINFLEYTINKGKFSNYPFRQDRTLIIINILIFAWISSKFEDNPYIHGKDITGSTTVGDV